MSEPLRSSRHVVNLCCFSSLRPSAQDAQKAFLRYGMAMYQLTGPSWEVPIADTLAEWLEQAVKLDPSVKEYGEALAMVRAKRDEINRGKLAARQAEEAESLKLNAMLREKQKSGKSLITVEGIVIVPVILAVILEASSASAPVKTSSTVNSNHFPQSKPCAFCGGTGSGVVLGDPSSNGTTCGICAGTGRFLSFDP